MVLAATEIPIELRSLGQVALGFGVQVSDVLANVAGDVAVGIALAGLGSVRAVAVAAMVAILAETGQFAMVHRDPSAVDVAANVIGAIIGTWVSSRWETRGPEVRITRRKAIAAGLLVFAVIIGVWTSSGNPLNARG